MLPTYTPKRFQWSDVLWIVFLAGLAALPPVRELHKQLILVAFGVLQIVEGRLISALRTGAALTLSF